MAFTIQAWNQPIKDSIQGGVYYDNINTNQPIAAFSPVSLGTATDVTNALAAGVPEAQLGKLFVPTPVSAGFPTRRIVGITMASTYSGLAISVINKGIFIGIANGAITADSLLFPTGNVTRTNAQTPLTNVPRMLLQVMTLPNGSTPTLSYNLGPVAATAITPTTGSGTNTLYYPLGYALTTTTAQYDLVVVQLECAPFYA